MTPDAELVMLLAGLHILGFAFAAVLFAMLIRTDSASSWSSDDEEDGGGGNDRPARPRPEGPHGPGLPLPDAVQAALRLRGHERLADAHPRPPRRAPHEPAPRPRIPTGS